MEFAVLLLMFLGIGFAMDRWLGTKPLFMLVWSLVAIVGQFVSMWYQYNAQMNMHEQQRRDKLMVSEECQPAAADRSRFAWKAQRPRSRSPVTDPSWPDRCPRADRHLRCHLANAGVSSSAYGIAIVLLNFAIAGWFDRSLPSRISLGLMMGAILFGYLIRSGLVFLGVLRRERCWLDVSSRLRTHGHHHTPRPPRVGAEVCGSLPCPPRP